MGDCLAPLLLFWVNLTTVLACALSEHIVLSPKLSFSESGDVIGRPLAEPMVHIQCCLQAIALIF